MRSLCLLCLLSALAAAQTANPAAQRAAPAAPAPPATAATTTESAPTLTVPAGTKVPLVLKHSISTKSARPGDNVYLETTFPVVQDNRILVPAGTYVQGVISSIKRPGRVSGRAEMLMHFTTMIFPNGYTVSLPGALENVPGSDSAKVKDQEGTVQSDSQKGKDVATVAGTAATGTVIGGVSHGGKGAAIGSGLGAATGLAIVLLTRGNEVRLESGTAVEMVLQRPLVLEESRLLNSPRELVPVDKNRTLQRPEMKPPPDTR